MSFQIAVRLPEQLAAHLDALVADGRFGTRAEAIRQAVEQLVDGERRRRQGELIAEGYRRVPQSDEEVAAATAAATRSVEEEPW